MPTSAAAKRGEGRAQGPIRVLSLIKGLGPGGGEQLLVNAAAAGDHSSFDHTVAYLIARKDALVPALREQGPSVVCLDVGRVPSPAWATRIRSLLRERFDVVHVHSPLVATVTRCVARTMPRAERPAIVTTEHNVASTYGFATRILDWVTAPLDDARFAVSEEVRRSLPAYLRRSTETLIHGVPLEAIRAHRGAREATRRALGVADADVLVLTVANYRAQKGYPTLFAAAKRVTADAPTARFVAAGQGPLEREVHAWHESAGLQETFQLLGYRDDVPDLLAAADMLVVASSAEGLPVIVMEALAMGVPVVATAVGGIPELVRDGIEGVLVDPGDECALADAITRLVRDAPLRARFGASAFDRADLIDAKRGVARYEHEYRRLVARPERRPPSMRGLAMRATKSVAALGDIARTQRNGIVVLAYHRIGGETGVEIDLPVELFERQLDYLAERTRVVRLDDALASLIELPDGTEPESRPVVVITFDDGTADFVDKALPLLVERGLPSTLYVASEFVETGRPFPNDGIPVSWAGLRDSRSTELVDVGSHTHTHLLLDRVGRRAAELELDQSIDLISSRLGAPPHHFAYPKALVGSADVRDAVRERFRSAAVAGTHPNRMGEADVYRLARSPIQVSDGMRWFERKVLGGMWLEDAIRRGSHRWRYASTST